MKTNQNNFARASALQITFSIALMFVFAILLALEAVATPTLGNYPDTIPCAQHRHDGYA